ncbi:GNAT family N-acetyltransferase [Rhodococcus sp. SRB_17]|nr:GNAT family N-acetyltransferase [Rhodococcus sp. SRB_17]
MAENAIITRVFDSPLDIAAGAWNALLAAQPHATPFMRHEYLAALHASGSATPRTGWTPRFITLWQAGALVAACPLYAKSHSYGEYVFDWAWAHAYEQHGLNYYPKAVVAVPFTPVPGTRLMARDAATRQALLEAVRSWCEEKRLSSLHVLFADDGDLAACTAGGLMPRHTVQFHWTNHGYRSFDEFLAQLAQDKRKKIRQERRRVAEAGVTFRWSRGADIAAADWDFFYRCYERTYLEHGNPPYLTRDFFARMQRDMAGHWLLFIAERAGRPIASSLIAINEDSVSVGGQKDLKPQEQVAYGRYWGALERVDCLHFEACYYQPLQWCIDHGVQRFEGGAQGEHKMARALLPVQAHSAHWLAHPAFADAVDRFLEREGAGVAQYLEHLQARSPFRQP